MGARELKEWAAKAPPGTMVPAEQIVAWLEDVDEAPVDAGASEFLRADEWARRKLGGARSAKTVARWCRTHQIAGAYQLPDGTWMVPWAATPPTKKSEPSKPEPLGRDGVVPLRELVRRRARR